MRRSWVRVPFEAYDKDTSYHKNPRRIAGDFCIVTVTPFTVTLYFQTVVFPDVPYLHSLSVRSIINPAPVPGGVRFCPYRRCPGSHSSTFPWNTRRLAPFFHHSDRSFSFFIPAACRDLFYLIPGTGSASRKSPEFSAAHSRRTHTLP